MKRFFKTLGLAVAKPSRYSELIKRPPSSAWGYFALLNFLLVFIGTIYFSLTVLPDAQKFLNDFQQKAREVYPAGLVITIEKGKLSTNMPDPVIFPLPDSKKNLIVIDTKANPLDFEKYNTVALVTQNFVSLRQERRAEIRTFSISQAPDASFDKTQFEKFVNIVFKYLRYGIPMIAIVVLIFGWIVAFIANLVGVLWFSILTWLGGKLSRLKLGFSRSFALAMYAITPLLILKAVFFALHWQAPIPLFYTILYLLFLFPIFRGLKKAYAH